jgi:hypothetical protein
MYLTLSSYYTLLDLSLYITNASIIIIVVIIFTLYFYRFLVSSMDHRPILEDDREGPRPDRLKTRVLRKLRLQQSTNLVTSVNHRRNIYRHRCSLDRDESLYFYRNQDRLRDYGYTIVGSRLHERTRRQGTRAVHASVHLQWFIWVSFPLD